MKIIPVILVVLVVLCILPLAATCQAQGTFVSARIRMQNHGGWGLQVNVGSNKGDKIAIDVRCDHDYQGQCFIDVPKFASGTMFSRTLNVFRHQTWEAIVPSTGDQTIEANYWWIGADVNYDVRILAIEPL